MTATEVNSRESEKLLSFSNSFTQLQVDSRALFNRVFCLLYRAKKFVSAGTPPAGIVVKHNEGRPDEQETVLAPSVKYCGKMAQALERFQSNSTRDVLAMHIQLASATQNPEILAVYNFQRLARREAINAGVPSEYLNSVSRMRQLLDEANEARSSQQGVQNDVLAAQAAKDKAQAYSLLYPS